MINQSERGGASDLHKFWEGFGRSYLNTAAIDGVVGERHAPKQYPAPGSKFQKHAKNKKKKKKNNTKKNCTAPASPAARGHIYSYLFYASQKTPLQNETLPDAWSRSMSCMCPMKGEVGWVKREKGVLGVGRRKGIAAHNISGRHTLVVLRRPRSFIAAAPLRSMHT